MFNDLITSEQQLRAIMGEPSGTAIAKETTTLTDASRAFIACSPFVLLATAGADGRCDVAPKGDAPGFVRVLDESRLVIPDRPGNRRFDNHRNVLETGRIGLLFLVPGRGETLRVNGRACITRDPALLSTMLVQGKEPWFAIGVEVEECYMHCAKALRRSQLWDPETWPDLGTVPTGAELLMAAVHPANTTLADLEKHLEEGYRARMY
ncbi:MAG: pyridoxamine 5'-phosphate oxidase family protein [Chloroflexi bacterium]|nr:pyridoxamine 5'-phosphate oxidase family protein [Chloroflexota bacterium]